MRRTATTLILAMSLSSWTATAQDAGAPPERGERPRQRERGRQGSPRPGIRRPLPVPVITALDVNGDGTIDAEEIANASAALTKLDKNRDGELMVEEYLPAPPEGPRGFGGPEGLPPGERGRPPGNGDRPGAGQASFDSSPVPKDNAEKRILAVLDDMNQNERRGMMSVPPNDGRYLRLLAESIGPRNVVEVGTSHGYSAIWLCLALRTTGGKLTTFEIDAERSAMARRNFERAGVDSLVTLIEGDAHKEVTRLKDPIDLLFLDADKEGYLDYLNKLLPLVRPGGLIVAHNMNAYQADPRYVKAITTDPRLDTLFVNLGGSGIGVTLKKR